MDQSDKPTERPAARVICFDGEGRVLLLHWRDPVDGRTQWEPPGGGIDPGETPLEAARRELHEETGLPGDAVREDLWIPVPRDTRWRGRRYVRTEPFYVARFPGAPEVTPMAFTDGEIDTYLGHAWLSLAEIAALPDALEPPDLIRIIETLMKQ
ncbi:8-oxo-dGTP pyrophosphatase MutT (NUDIX family) [Thermocatellispora tengchongensis]|uniref:8-oxo-dGTP pyrophosphatase MutT (NUDIX family) n=1 Tax=Thermocatellispora tengchongensis TaxID=1073253 RepID=A0A840PER5_9ACTN|nr:NUDIX domain-containing protein [Thermocatellispora tengchongensis]MBB5136341.1 8-oxo-dGTP pyrophosphatase MutT (NUDIX family) [Thermocatellispora tengchongensis]